MSQYRTIKGSVESLYKDKGSRFIGLIFPFETEESLKETLNLCREKYPKATHYCYAYRIGRDGNAYRSNDDGEPKGTAGAPILNQIDSFDVTNVIIVVVRYYGGTKLGVSGLINAYKSASKAALESVEIIEKELKVKYEVTCSYQEVHDLLKAVNRFRLEIVRKTFGEECVIHVNLNENDELKLNQLINNLHNIDLTIRKLGS